MKRIKQCGNTYEDYLEYMKEKYITEKTKKGEEKKKTDRLNEQKFISNISTLLQKAKELTDEIVKIEEQMQKLNITGEEKNEN